MKYLFISIVVMLLSAGQKPENVFVCKEVNTRLYSEAPLENIEATSIKGFAVINIATSEIQFNIPVRSMQFRKSLMQEHFNENYMESDKYPNASFKGQLNDKIDLSKDGEYPVSVTGDLEVHGIKQQRTISGTVRVVNGRFSINARFNVLCKDHQIKIPSLVFKNIAESIQITVSGNFVPYPSVKT